MVRPLFLFAHHLGDGLMDLSVLQVIRNLSFDEFPEQR
jgi:hypothetical protein